MSLGLYDGKRGLKPVVILAHYVGGGECHTTGDSRKAVNEYVGGFTMGFDELKHLIEALHDGLVVRIQKRYYEMLNLFSEGLRKSAVYG